MEVALTRHKSNYSASGQNRKQGRLCWGAGRRWRTPTRAQSLLHILSTTASAPQPPHKRVGLGSALVAGVALLLPLGSCW